MDAAGAHAPVQCLHSANAKAGCANATAIFTWNIVFLDGEPRAFDCIEFNPDLRWIDVMNEVPFLVMDLHAANRPDLARQFLNTCLEFSGDYGGLRRGVRFGTVLSKRAMNCS